MAHRSHRYVEAQGEAKRPGSLEPWHGEHAE